MSKYFEKLNQALNECLEWQRGHIHLRTKTIDTQGGIMGLQLMKYTELMAKIDENFKDRDDRITRLEGIHLEIWKTLCEQKMRIENIANTVDNHDQTLDDLIKISNADDEGECEDEASDEDECELWSVDLPMDIVAWISNDKGALDLIKGCMKSMEQIKTSGGAA